MKDKLNILLICKSLPWKFNGGIQTHVWELSKALVGKGHTITILTGGPYRQSEKSSEKSGINIIEIPYFPGRYLKPVSMLAEELSFNISVKRWVSQYHQPFDIIHSQGRSGYLLATLGMLRHKLVTTVHGLISNEVKRARWFDFNVRLHAKLSTRLEKRLIRSSTLCLAVSKDLEREINHQYGPESLQVIPNGVQIDELPLKPALQASRFLFVGRLHAVKGILPLVNAMSLAPAHIKLDIIGDGPQYGDLERLIAQKGLKNQVRLLGAHSNESIHKTIHFYQALILPSFYETQGIVLLEANVHAVPVVASDIPAIRETVEHKHNGLLCNPHDSQSFIEAMTYLNDHPTEALKMGQNGRQRVEQYYSWEQIVDQTINAYQQIAS